MSKNTAKIISGLRALVKQPEEISSGIVTAIDTDKNTIDVLRCGDAYAVKGVLLGTFTKNTNGLILYPKIGCNVVIASIDGPGMWCLVSASEITRATIKIEHVVYTIDATQVNIQNGDVVLNISDESFKIKTQSESLYKLLKDCFTYLSQLTVSTPAGTSSVPVNIDKFTDLITRIDNLLSV